MADLATPPVFAWDPDQRALLAFRSADSAARFFSPWAEAGTITAWDGEGRLVRFALTRGEERVLGVFPVERERVVPASVEAAPEHADDLRRALLAALERGGRDRADLEPLALADLVREAEAALRRE